MKLVIKNALAIEDVITFELRPSGADMQLVVKKNHHVEQVILTFIENGTIKKHLIFSDIGFNLDSDKFIKLY